MGGNVTVNASGQAVVSGGVSDRRPVERNRARRRGGKHQLDCRGPLASSSGAISSTAQASGGGDIMIQTPSLTLSGASSVSASAIQAGRINIDPLAAGRLAERRVNSFHQHRAIFAERE